MRGQNQIVVARVHRNLVDRHGRQVRLHTGPAPAAIGRHEQPALRAQIQDVRIPGVLGDRPDRLALRQTAAHRLPRLAVVPAGVHVGREIARAVPVERHVDGAIGELRRLDARHVGVGRHAGDVRRHVRPARAAVARDLHLPVVGACVVQPLDPRRLGEGRQRPVGTYAVVARDRDVAPHHAHQLQLVAVGGGGQIGADRLPDVATVGRLEDAVRRDVDRRRIVRRHHHRRVPVPAVLRRIAHRLRPDRLALVRHPIDAVHPATLRLGVENVRIGRVDQRHEAVAAAHDEPIVVDDAA